MEMEDSYNHNNNNMFIIKLDYCCCCCYRSQQPISATVVLKIEWSEKTLDEWIEFIFKPTFHKAGNSSRTYFLFVHKYDSARKLNGVLLLSDVLFAQANQMAGKRSLRAEYSS